MTKQNRILVCKIKNHQEPGFIHYRTGPISALERLQCPSGSYLPKIGKQSGKALGGRRENGDAMPLAPWTELPREITWNILRRVGVVEMLGNAEKVCTAWRRVCKDPSMWRVIEMLKPEDIPGRRFDLEKICCSLVERSEGQLEDVKLKHIASDELLYYIAGRAKKLKSLQLGSFFYITDDGLIEAVKRFPLLEKLELDVVIAPISSETLEKVGRSCPLLKSFAFNNHDARYLQNERNEDAMAIARSMPGLRHLQLMGNGLTNVGLEAILDGCPHLESLDLRRCFHVELYGDLGNRLSEQIKCLKYPNDDVAL